MSLPTHGGDRSAGGTARQALQFLATVACAIAGGSAASAIHMPLPWLLGSMLGVACIRMAGKASCQPVPARKAAQIYIGSAIGLYFTPVVFAQMAGLAGWIVLGALVGLAMSVLAARWLQKLAKVDGPTAIYAVATLVGWFFSHWHIPNPWVLGALVVSGACASQGLIAHMPEMGIISKIFGYGAPIVTSFHLTRILCTVFLTQSMAGWMLRSGWVKAH